MFAGSITQTSTVGVVTTTAPSGYLLCNGDAISRTTYSNLFAVTSTTYGSGDGLTTFNLPNLKGKVPVGFNSSETEFDALGETGGAKTHTLTSTEIPGHTHTTNIGHGHLDTLAAPAHTHNIGHGHADTLAAPAHTHVVNPDNTTVNINAKDVITGPDGTSDFTFVSGSTRSFVDATASVNIAAFNSEGASNTTLTGTVTDLPTTASGAASATTLTGGVTDLATTNVTSSTGSGGGEAHNNLQPYIVLNYIIKV
jgi:microcystin-dependent protein